MRVCAQTSSELFNQRIDAIAAKRHATGTFPSLNAATCRPLSIRQGAESMETAPTFDQVERSLTYAYKHRYKPLGPAKTMMVGMLFARPSSLLFKSDILPILSDFHFRSADHIDFFFAGYAYASRDLPGYEPVPGPAGEPWFYHPRNFDTFRRDVEKKTTWKYSGGADLLLTNVSYDATKEVAALDFGSTIVCQLEIMKRQGAIESVEMFFESIFSFAESCTGDDPAWGFSDQQGGRALGSALQEVVLSFLPKSIRRQVTRAKHFGIIDLAKSAGENRLTRGWRQMLAKLAQLSPRH